MSSKSCFFTILTLFFALFISFTEAANSEILSIRSHVVVKNGKRITTDTIQLKINNQYGENEQTVYYSKMNRLSHLKAWVEDSRGNLVRVLSGKEFGDRTMYQEAMLYADEREKYFKPNFSVYPYRFCYTYVHTSEQFCMLVNDYSESSADCPLRECVTYVHLPFDYKVRTYLEHVDEVRSDTVGDCLVTRYTMRNIPVKDAKNDSPLFLESNPVLSIVPENFYYGVAGSNARWEDFGHWFAKLNDGLRTLPESDVLLVKHMLADVPDTLSKIRMLYHYLQDHTRYVNVKFGVGGHRSYPASYVSLNKYGDCKALSNYMMALLECAGIKSYFVLVNSGEYADPFYTDFPSSQFNHVLLMVPIGKDTIWLENTSSIDPMGYISVFTQNRPALLIDGHRSRLVRIPSLDESSVTSVTISEVVLKPDLSADLRIHSVYKGREFEYFNAIKKDVSSDRQTDLMHHFVPYEHFEDLQWVFQPTSRESAEAGLTLRLRVSEIAKKHDLMTYVSQVPLNQLLTNFPKPNKKTVVLPYPRCEVDSVCYHLPENYQVVMLPDSQTIAASCGSYVIRWFSRNGVVCCRKEYVLHAGTYPEKAYVELYDFVTKVKATGKSTILLQEKE